MVSVGSILIYGRQNTRDKKPHHDRMDGTGVTRWSEEQSQRICAYRFQTPEMPTDGIITGKYVKSAAPAVPTGIDPAGIEGFTSGGGLLGVGLALAALVLFLA